MRYPKIRQREERVGKRSGDELMIMTKKIREKGREGKMKTEVHIHACKGR